jgi:glycosyltransferase involved in cell wall biosynthesis
LKKEGKLKNIFLTWRSSAGGIEVQIPYICEMMKDSQPELFVLRPSSIIEENIFQDNGIKVTTGSNNTVLMYIKLFSFARKNKKALFYGFNLGPYVLFILKAAGVEKINYFIHGTKYWKTAIQKTLRKFFWRLASSGVIFISNSEYSKKVFYDQVLKITGIKVIYNFFDTQKFVTTIRSYDKNNLRVFYVGRLAEGKNLVLWINIAKEIISKYPGSSFHLYGDGPIKQKLADLIINEKLERKIFLHGFRKDIEQVYRENDLLMFLSEYESFGNVVVESILSGVPVLVSKIPAMEEIFRDKPEFIIDLNGNPAAEIIKKIADYDQLKSAADELACSFRKKYSMERFSEEIRTVNRDA